MDVILPTDPCLDEGALFLSIHAALHPGVDMKGPDAKLRLIFEALNHLLDKRDCDYDPEKAATDYLVSYAAWAVDIHYPLANAIANIRYLAVRQGKSSYDRITEQAVERLSLSA